MIKGAMASPRKDDIHIIQKEIHERFLENVSYSALGSIEVGEQSEPPFTLARLTSS
jgi:hypothetical protein